MASEGFQSIPPTQVPVATSPTQGIVVESGHSTQDRTESNPFEDERELPDDPLPSPSLEIPNIPQPHSWVEIFEVWWWELLTWFLGTMAFALTLGFFAHFHNKPLSTWDSKVQITAMVAGLTQIAQSALVISASSCISQWKWNWLRSDREAIDLQRFDEASRGAEGSIKLLVYWILSAAKSVGSFRLDAVVLKNSKLM